MTFPMAMLRSLKPNWNSYGAPAIDERCIQKAYEIWRQLSGEWQVVPCSDGGVQLEQHRDGFDIEITVSAVSAQETPVDCPKCGFKLNSIAHFEHCGHGHVTRRHDGMLAKCGGPLICKACAAEKVAVNQA